MNINSTIPIISGRLYLDRFTTDDWKNFYRIEKSPEHHRFNCPDFRPRTKSRIQKYVTELSRQDYNDLLLPMVFAVRLTGSKEMIGYIGLKNGKLEKQGMVEIYYSVYKRFWNKGYGTEALKSMIRFGFDVIGLHKMFCGCDIDNIASKTIMEKAGMRFESRWRKDRIRNGAWTDGLGFAILEEDISEGKS